MAVQREHQSHWTEDGTCSYCGSLSPEQLFAAIEAGCELGPTDKNYKVYVHRLDPKAGEPCVYGWANHAREGYIEVTAENIDTLPPGPTGRRDYKIGDFIEISKRPALTHDKFYFQHLNEEERQRFVELMNEKKLILGHPGFFYRLPFFVARQESK